MSIEFERPERVVGQTAVLQRHELLPDAMYWRVTAGGELQLPAGPVVLSRLPADFAEGAVWSSRGLGTEVHRDQPLFLFPYSPAAGRIPGWLALHGDGELRVAAVAPRLARNGLPIELAARAERPWIIASPHLSVVVVTGEGYVDSVDVTCLGAQFDELDSSDQSVDALPEDYWGLACYAEPQGTVADWRQRVLSGAPNGPVPYAPDALGASYDPQHELNRVKSLISGSDSVDAWLRRAYEAAAAGEADDIHKQSDNDLDVTPWVGLRHRAVAALSIAALDPGVARLLARGGSRDLGWPHWDGEGFGLLVAQVPFLELGSGADRELTRSESLYDQALNDGYGNLLSRLEHVPPTVDGRRLQSTMLTVALPAYRDAAPSPPAKPELTEGGQAAWAEDGQASWRQPIELGAVVPLGPISLCRTAPHPTTLHAHHNLVASPLFASWRQPRGPATVTAVTSVDDSAGDRPGAGQPVELEVHVGDWIGQWSKPAQRSFDPPRRPPPPPCTVEAVFVRGPVAAGDDEASPGDITIVLNAFRSNAPGAAALDHIEWSVDGGGTQSLDVPGGESARFTESVLAPATRPGQAQTVHVVAEAVDVVGQHSSRTFADVGVADPRPVAGPLVAPRLLVTARPSADPEVSITLTVAAAEAAGTYRFYFASEASIRAASGLPTSGYSNTPRATRAKDLRDVSGGPQTCYTLSQLQPSPVKNGHATVTIVLPSGASDVVAVRAVPVTTSDGNEHEGVSAPFADVDPVYVVVPYDDSPGVPSVTATSPTPGEVRVVVTLDGVGGEIERYVTEPLEARLVEFVPGVDPVYWPEIDVIPLEADGPRLSGGRNLSTPGWRRIAVAACVRYPAEAVLEAGASADPGEVTALGQNGPPLPIDSPWGPLSVPHWVDVEGAQPTVDVTRDPDGNFVVRVSPLPATAPGPAWSAEVHRGYGLTELAERLVLSAEAAEFTVTAPGASPPPPDPAERVALVLVEPFGRRHDPIELA